MNDKIEKLLTQLTLEEKVAMCHANSLFTSAGVSRLGITDVVMSDGPHGVRATIDKDSWTFLDIPEDACTYLPTGTALAATWNPELGCRFGQTLGAEARYRGKDVILGPGINIIRTPLCGRNFEYFSEDPCLIAKMAPYVVKGIQSQAVAACVKHFCLNNQELDRYFVDVQISPRALREIYLPGFYAAVTQGQALSVMGAYNRFDGQHCCHNDYLVNGILKGEWGFRGAYIADWGGCHDTQEAIFNGLDIEMGSGADYDGYCLADPFLAEARENEEARQSLDDKVRRILRLMLSVKKGDPERSRGAYNTPQHQQAAYDIAAEAMVLLKNEGGVLPLDKNKIRKLLVIGPNAAAVHASGGNSSGVKALYEVTPLQGLSDRFGEQMEIEYHSGVIGSGYSSIPVQHLNIIDTTAGCSAFKQVGYTEGKPTEVWFSDDGSIHAGTADCYEISASLTVPETGHYAFRFTADGNMQMTINEVMQGEAEGGEIICDCHFVAGEVVELRVLLKRSQENLTFSIGWHTPKMQRTEISKDALLEKAAQADAVIYCGGLNHSYDCESFDKKTMALPAEQDALIPKLLKENTNTVVVLTAGSPVEMPWIREVKAVLWSWYAGMEGGHALADILFGKVNPSGKLPFTLPYCYADSPVARYGEYKSGSCRYNEGIFVGYRGFEKDGIAPMFPFGHGLSYSAFSYSDLQIKPQNHGAEVTFTVTNTGNREAKETAQLYVGDPVCSVLRPPKELRNFEKVHLLPGQSKTLTLPVSTQDLSFYDEVTNDWVLEPGQFQVFIGSSSRDVRLQGSFEISNETSRESGRI